MRGSDNPRSVIARLIAMPASKPFSTPSPTTATAAATTTKRSRRHAKYGRNTASDNVCDTAWITTAASTGSGVSSIHGRHSSTSASTTRPAIRADFELVALCLPWIELTPEPVLAAVVIHAVSHTLSLAAFRPYFAWRRDRFVVVAAAVLVVSLGVLNGLLAGIAISVAMTLRGLSEPRMSELGRRSDGHDYLGLQHQDVVAVPGVPAAGWVSVDCAWAPRLKLAAAAVARSVARDLFI